MAAIEHGDNPTPKDNRYNPNLFGPASEQPVRFEPIRRPDEASPAAIPAVDTQRFIPLPAHRISHEDLPEAPSSVAHVGNAALDGAATSTPDVQHDRHTPIPSASKPASDAGHGVSNSTSEIPSTESWTAFYKHPLQAAEAPAKPHDSLDALEHVEPQRPALKSVLTRYADFEDMADYGTGDVPYIGLQLPEDDYTKTCVTIFKNGQRVVDVFDKIAHTRHVTRSYDEPDGTVRIQDHMINVAPVPDNAEERIAVLMHGSAARDERGDDLPVATTEAIKKIDTALAEATPLKISFKTLHDTVEQAAQRHEQRHSHGNPEDTFRAGQIMDTWVRKYVAKKGLDPDSDQDQLIERDILDPDRGLMHVTAGLKALSQPLPVRHPDGSVQQHEGRDVVRKNYALVNIKFSQDATGEELGAFMDGEPGSAIPMRGGIVEVDLSFEGQGPMRTTFSRSIYDITHKPISRTGAINIGTGSNLASMVRNFIEDDDPQCW